jgi:hypothetical protein
MHLTRGRRRITLLGTGLTAVLLTVQLIGGAGAAEADGHITDVHTTSVNCQSATDPGCTLSAGSSRVANDAATTRPPTPAGQPAPRQCHYLTGAVAPCTDPQLGWMGSDGCYYEPVAAPSPALQTAFGGPGKGPGTWYDFVCPGVPGTGGGTEWLPANSPVLPAAPQVLAQQAVARLSLPSSPIQMSPTRTPVTGVPVWWWLNPSTWGARSATAAVTGASVTATASPASVEWSAGDGTSVTCTGPGTAWRPGDDPRLPSPTCGHTYTRASADRPGGTFTVTATVSWTVGWAGGGQTGMEAPLTTTTTLAVHVDQVHAVVLPPTGQ